MFSLQCVQTIPTDLEYNAGVWVNFEVPPELNLVVFASEDETALRCGLPVHLLDFEAVVKDLGRHCVDARLLGRVEDAQQVEVESVVQQGKSGFFLDRDLLPGRCCLLFNQAINYCCFGGEGLACLACIVCEGTEVTERNVVHLFHQLLLNLQLRLLPLNACLFFAVGCQRYSAFSIPCVGNVTI